METSKVSICYSHMWNIKLYFAIFEQPAQNKCNDKVTFVCPVRLHFRLGKTADQVAVKFNNRGATVNMSRKRGFAPFICQILDTKHRSNLVSFIINNLHIICII